MDEQTKTRALKVPPRRWTVERAAKVAAVEGLSLTPRMKRALAAGGDEARQNILAAAKKT